MRYYQQKSQKSEWSARIALLFLVLFLITLVFHRFGIPNLTLAFEPTTIPKLDIKVPVPVLGLDPDDPSRLLSTPTAMRLFGVAVAGAALAVALAIGAFISVWREGQSGIGNAFLGFFAGMVMLAMPLWSLPSLLLLPRIHEVSTDTDRPPAFTRLAAARHGATTNPATYQREDASLQVVAYPDIRPLAVSRPLEDTYGAVRDAVRALKWKVVSEDAPSGTQAGMIEAVDRTMIFGFTDDVVIRVTGGERSAQVDVRSSSRHGEHDLGRNADRVRSLFTEVKTRLNELDKAERLERAVELREKRVKKALEDKRAREAAEKERQRKERLASRRAMERTQASTAIPGMGGQGISQNPPPSGAQDEPGQSRKRHSGGGAPILRKFWQLFGQ